MRQFFRPNIDGKGRVARLIWGVLCVLGGGIIGCVHDWRAGGVLMALGIFSFIEAARGWCILRACGIKTKF